MPRAKNWIRRHASVTETLDSPTQWNLCWGHFFGVRDITSRAHFAEAWRRYGVPFLDRYIAAYPGSRPMVCYLLDLADLVAPLSWHPNPKLRHFLHVDGLDDPVETSSHLGYMELKTLVDANLISSTEIALANKRLESTNYASPHRFI